MKIVNIFGLVVAVHVVVLLLIFAIPGCRTTSKSPDAQIAAMPMEPERSAPSSSIQSAPAMTAADLNPPLAGSSTASTGQVPTIQSPVSGMRSSPTRPGSPTASALQTAPVSGVTPATTYTVVRGDSLWSVAKRHGVTVRELAAANNISEKAGLKLDQKLVIPNASTPDSGSASPTTPAPAPGTSAASADGSTYVIRPGDTLGAIARRHGTTVRELKAMNNLRSDLVRVGDTLTIPEAGAATSTPPPAAATPAPAQTTAANANLARGAGGTMKHVVAPGETLGAIARRYGVKLGDVAAANNIADPARIRPGQEITIPGWQAPPNTSSSSAVPTQYPESFQPAQPSSDETPTISTGDSQDVPVIQVEESVPTLSVEPAPENGSGGGGGAEPPLFN